MALSRHGMLAWRVAWALVLALCASGFTHATTGRVINDVTQRPVAGAVITTSAGVTSTRADGRFDTVQPVTRVAVRAVGYGRNEVTVEGSAPVIIRLAPFRPKAIYLSVYGITNTSLRDAALGVVQPRTAINALVIDIKGDRGLMPYRSPARERRGVGFGSIGHVPMTRDFASLLRRLHDRHLYLIARIVVFKDDPLASAHPEWSVHDADGRPWRDREGQRWLDPFSPDAWQHNLDVAEEAARMGFDEIQFDYVRFPDQAGLQFAEPNTRANRTAAIVGFLRAARERLAPYNVFVAADIFGYVCWNTNDTAIGQQIEQLAEPLDYVSPMLYPSGFTWGLPGLANPVTDPGQIVSRSLAQAQRRTGLAGTRFRPWLQAFRDYAFDRRPFGKAEVRAQTDAADAAGSDGWMLWNPRNQYDAASLPLP